MAGSFEIPQPLLAQAAFDRADQVRGDAARLADGWPSARVLLVDPRGHYPVEADGALRWTPSERIGAQPPEDAVFLGVAGSDLWAMRVAELDGPAADPRGGAHLLGADDAGLLATALGMLNWHRAAEYSPVDGARTLVDRAGWVRRHPESGAEEYPRTDPAVIMVVHDGADRVLLGRQHQWPHPMFSTLAGFVEPGESLEQCVIREVHEEAGIAVSAPRYLGSQPWPFPRSLMLGFEAVADPDEPLSFNDGELADARWFTRDEVREALDQSSDWGTDHPDASLMLPPSVSIARSLITGWASATS
ncbi:NAD(+) diphosphatase [Gordonia sp. (in: high G+C Gram-positive bacteria)]|uniref:NAD(+) diphosphatase n=1 Tax=Gordonia sp. (in: high G+C Gram-positive bacteria) TaxID=84139 RepID=UPI0039E61E93